MVPPDLTGFLAATATAAGTLIGLLFVAISLRPHEVLGSRADVETRRIAESAFTALVSVFFLSLAGLIPRTNIGFAAAVLGALGIISALRRRPRSGGARWLVSVFSLAAYAAELFIGIQAIQNPNDTQWPDNLSGVLLAALAVALARAWTLLRGAGPV